jgi:hypothetical protein
MFSLHQGMDPFTAHFEARADLEKSGGLTERSLPKPAAVQQPVTEGSLQAKYIKSGLDPLTAHFKAIEEYSKLNPKAALKSKAASLNALPTKAALEKKFIAQGLDPMTASLKAAVAMATREKKTQTASGKGPSIKTRAKNPTSRPSLAPTRSVQQSTPATAAKVSSAPASASSPAQQPQSKNSSKLVLFGVGVALLLALVGAALAKGSSEDGAADSGEAGGGLGSGGSYQNNAETADSEKEKEGSTGSLV